MLSFTLWDERSSQALTLLEETALKGSQGIRSMDGAVARLSLFFCSPTTLSKLPQMGRGVEEDTMQDGCGNAVTLEEPHQVVARIWVIQ